MNLKESLMAEARLSAILLELLNESYPQDKILENVLDKAMPYIVELKQEEQLALLKAIVHAFEE